MVSLTLSGDPDQIEGSTLKFELTLDAPAATESIVFIDLSPAGVAIAPATVTIAAGSTTALFDVTTLDVNGDTALVVTATFDASSAFVQTTVIDGNNQPPTAQDDHYFLTESLPLHVDAASGVIAGKSPANADADPENDTLAASLIDGPQHGTLTLNSDGSFDYPPVQVFKARTALPISSTTATTTATSRPLH